MTKVFIGFLFFLFAGTGMLQAQSFKLSGRFTHRNQQPIVWAELYLKTTEGSVVKTALVDEGGYFVFEALGAAQYVLEVVYFGKSVYQQDIAVESDLNLGTTTIESATEMAEIVVEVQKKLIERKVDRLVFNVENALVATGGDALDALKVTPGIRVQNDLITFVGKSKMAVMIDDRLIQLSGEDLSNYLKTIPSDHIKSIEVITTPPAKYDAEGNSGLINIQLKTAKKDSWNALFGSSYLQRFYSTSAIQGSFNFNKNKWTIQASVNGGSATRRNVDTGKTYFTEQFWSNNSPRRIDQNYFNTRLGLDYQISDKWTTGLQYLGNFYNMDIREYSRTKRADYLSQLVQSSIESQSAATDIPNLNSINWHNIYKMDSLGTKLSIDLDYFNYDSSNKRSYEGQQFTADQILIPNTFFAGVNTNQKEVRNLSAKADVELPTAWTTWIFGAKFSKTTTKNDLIFFNKETGIPILDPSQTNTFDYSETNEAFYVSTHKKFNDNWQVQLGLRAEITQSKGYSLNYDQTNAKDYFKLFPSLYVVYSPNENHSWSLDYSRRVNRPNYEQLNPFRMNENAFMYIEGNPFLQPSIMDNLTFTHTYKGKWVNAFFLSKSADGFEQVSIIDANTHITQVIPLNYLTQYSIGLSESYTFNPWSWWNSTNAFSTAYRYAKSSVSYTDRTYEGMTTALSTYNDFILNRDKTLLLSVNYWLDFPGVSSFYKETGSSSLDVAVKTYLLDRKLTVVLSGNDILGGQRSTSTTSSNGLKLSYRNYYDSQSVRLTVNYSFGNNQLKVSKRDFGNAEENNRVN